MAKTSYPRVHRALKLAVKAHKKQDRDGDNALPYATHPVDVLNLVRYAAGVDEEDVLCAALLHDLLEETDVTLKEITQEFGTAVAGLIKEMTREEPDPQTMQLPEPELWKIRNGMMMAEIERMSKTAKLLKLADRCSNLTASLVSKKGEKLTRYVSQSREILEHIDRSVCPPLWDRIDAMLDSAAATKKPRRNLRHNGAAPAPRIS